VDQRKEETMTTLKVGEIWRSDITGRMFKVKTIANQMVVLQSVNGANQILTSKESLNLFYAMVPDANDSGFSSEGNRLTPAVRRKEESCGSIGSSKKIEIG
jgi:hypothetical protein